MEPLSDPLQDRQVKSIKPPPHQPLSTHLIWPRGQKSQPDWICLRDHLSQQGRLQKQDLIKLILDTNRILQNEGNLLYVHDPVTIVGDIHGQFYDLLQILEVGGPPENTKYLFLGDFVDRGAFSIETLILLYSMKQIYPETVHLLRGNHECRQMTTFFNFRDECQYKYDQETYQVIMDSFDLLPLACLLNGMFLCVHGGLSPDLQSLDDIKKIQRFKEPPRRGIFCDLLWSDPVDHQDGICQNKFRGNDIRGCSYFYGIDATKQFLQNNNLISIIRAHEAQLEGYQMHRWTGNNDFPMILTVFSAPNYCDVYKNKGAVIQFQNNTLNIQQFNYSEHPYILPHFQNIFTWSIPFVAEKVTEMLYHVIKPNQNDELSDDQEFNDTDFKNIKQSISQRNIVVSSTNITQIQTATTIKSEKTIPNVSKAEILKKKIQFVSKLAQLHSTLREESESIISLKGLCPDKRIPQGLLIEGSNAIQNAIEGFQQAQKADVINQQRPSIEL